jgi:metal-sulfur cluster biosynthetic enzyme
MTEEQIRNALCAVYDPEIGVNIIDLGLVYKVAVQKQNVAIDLTMTTPACPLHEVIIRNMKDVLASAIPGIGIVDVNLVWQPVWTPDMMSEAAKKQLGWSV